MAEAEDLFPRDHNRPPEDQQTPQQEWLDGFLQSIGPQRQKIAERIDAAKGAHAKTDQAAHQVAETIKALIAEEAALKAQADALTKPWDAALRAAGGAVADTAKQIAAAKARLQKLLTEYLEAQPEPKFTTSYGVRAFLRSAESIEIADPDLVPPDLWKPDESAIKAALKAGREVPGVTVTTTRKAQVS